MHIQIRVNTEATVIRDDQDYYILDNSNKMKMSVIVLILVITLAYFYYQYLHGDYIDVIFGLLFIPGIARIFAMNKSFEFDRLKREVRIKINIFGYYFKYRTIKFDSISAFINTTELEESESEERIVYSLILHISTYRNYYISISEYPDDINVMSKHLAQFCAKEPIIYTKGTMVKSILKRYYYFIIISFVGLIIYGLIKEQLMMP